MADITCTTTPRTAFGPDRSAATGWAERARSALSRLVSCRKLTAEEVERIRWTAAHRAEVRRCVDRLLICR